MSQKVYFIATHTAYNSKGEETYGPANYIYDSAKTIGKAYFIRHSLFGGRKSTLTTEGKQTDIGAMPSGNLLIRSYEHVRLNISTVSRIKGDSVYVGTDPVNALSGVFLKKLKKIKKFVFFTADYADNRFSNPLINFIYHSIDRLCLLTADEVWNVSSRIVKKRKQQGVPDSKNKLVPNSPYYYAIKRTPYAGSKDLVITSHLSASLDFQAILKIIEEVLKKHTDIRLKIIGTGPKEDEFKTLVKQNKLTHIVEFMGQKKHEEVLNILTKSFLGFALYTNENSWNRYGDSAKAREYAACGLPIIINTVPSTADDVKEYNAGLVVDSIKTDTIASFIIRCLEDTVYYAKLRKNALRLGKDFDKAKILKEVI